MIYITNHGLETYNMPLDHRGCPQFLQARQSAAPHEFEAEYRGPVVRVVFERALVLVERVQHVARFPLPAGAPLGVQFSGAVLREHELRRCAPAPGRLHSNAASAKF